MIPRLTEAAPSTEHIAGLAGLIKQYGMEVIIVAVFIILFIFLFRYIIDSNKKMYERITEMQDNMLKMMKEYIKETSDTIQNKTENVLEIFIKLDMAMKDVMTSTKLKLDCDRLAVYAFHNGTHASHGFPFFKVTCISEQIKRASILKPTLKDQVAIPLAMFDKSLYDVYTHGHLIIKDTEADKDKYPTLTALFRNNHAKAAIMVAIYNSKNEILGIAMAEYANEIEDDDMANCIKEELIQVAINLAPIMEYSNYQEKV